MRSWCGLYGGAAYMLTPESSFDDFGVVRLVHRAAYILKITVHVLFTGQNELTGKSIVLYC